MTLTKFRRLSLKNCAAYSLTTHRWMYQFADWPEGIIKTDLEKLDAHIIAPAEYEDAPELTDEQLAAAVVHEGTV